MYYKIENTECELYKKFHEMRTKELRFQKENEEAIQEKVGLNYENFYGRFGQQTFGRVSTYNGFVFTEPEKVDLKIWKPLEGHPETFVPNKKTKLGREMAQFLLNGLKGGSVFSVFKILGVKNYSKFKFPLVEICNDVIVIYLGEDYKIDSNDIIEITSREFEEIRQKSISKSVC